MTKITGQPIISFHGLTYAKQQYGRWLELFKTQQHTVEASNNKVRSKALFHIDDLEDTEGLLPWPQTHTCKDGSLEDLIPKQPYTVSAPVTEILKNQQPKKNSTFYMYLEVPKGFNPVSMDSVAKAVKDILGERSSCVKEIDN